MNSAATEVKMKSQRDTYNPSDQVELKQYSLNSCGEDRVIDELKSRISNQVLSISNLREKNTQYYSELKKSDALLQEKEALIKEHEQSISEYKKSFGYQFLVHAKNAQSSFSGLVRFPIAIFRLIVRRSKLKKSTDKSKPDAVEFRPQSEELTITAIVDDYISKLKDRNNIKSILYADIDLNIIDGSSVWLTSMANLLAQHGGVILIVKRKIISDDLFSGIQKENVHCFFPDENKLDLVSSESAIKIIRKLDRLLPNVQRVFVRGLDASVHLHEDRQFKNRTVIYLTDFYQYGSEGIGSTPDQVEKVKSLSKHVDTFLVQTDQIGSKIAEMSGAEIKQLKLPPVLPRLEIEPDVNKNQRLKMVYAGKVTPEWGIDELLDWLEKYKNSGRDVDLTIIANKISAKHQQKKYKKKILERFEQLNVVYIEGLPRDQVLKFISESDVVWCWRPKALEESTIELSTKLIEAAAMGKPAVAYPSQINIELMGEDYPYFVSDVEEVSKIVDSSQDYNFQLLSEKVRKAHGFKSASYRLKALFKSKVKSNTKLLFAGHDLKFIDPYISDLKAKNISVDCDTWEWGAAQNIDRSHECLKHADIIFCEWGLANAVWYSQNVIDKPLYVRIHLQEIHERAAKFGGQIKHENVTKFIFVSARVRDEAVSLFEWPISKTIVIPNFVLDDEYSLGSASTSTITLGMVGIVPERKRMDRALDVLSGLVEQGVDARLKIKGHRPEDLDFMHAPGRKNELEYYNKQYERINSDSLLSERVIFDPWGNDVAEWYNSIDYVLSCSDFESFHYSLADGILSGCIPVIWPWEEAKDLYKNEWIIEDSSQAVNKILFTEKKSDNEINNIKIQNRQYVSNKYGWKSMSRQLSTLLGLEDENIKNSKI